jgi:hypothetical protein
MAQTITYSPRERFWLWTLAVVGAVGLNGAFLYGTALHPDAVQAALTNPISAAFIVEAMLLMFVVPYLLGRWGVSDVKMRWFVTLSLVGGLAFALPVVLLWRTRRTTIETQG